MKVVNYLTSVPKGNTNKQKEELIIKFHNGVQRVGDESHLMQGYFPVDCDAAVIQGWVYSDTRPSHLDLRKKVIDHQRKNRKYTIVADANLFLYQNKANPHGYLRYSLNGVFPDTGIYCDDNVDETRWNRISTNTGIRIEEPKINGNHILILLQRQGGWSMGGEDIIDWTMNTVRQIRKTGCDRIIRIRPHPGCKKSKLFLNPKHNPFYKLNKVQMCDPTNMLENDLRNCHAVINKNSSGIVGPIIKGYNAFVTEPNKSQCAEVSNHNLLDIEQPKMFDRLKWLQRISMFHWSFSELETGQCWSHIKNYVQ